MCDIIPFKQKQPAPHSSYNLPETTRVIIKHAEFYLQLIKSEAQVEFTDPVNTIAELLDEIRNALEMDNWGVK